VGESRRRRWVKDRGKVRVAARALKFGACTRIHAGRGVEGRVDLQWEDSAEFGVHEPFALGGGGAYRQGWGLQSARASALGRKRAARGGLRDLDSAGAGLSNVYAVLLQRQRGVGVARSVRTQDYIARSCLPGGRRLMAAVLESCVAGARRGT
jgi:hypothetical protein